EVPIFKVPAFTTPSALSALTPEPEPHGATVSRPIENSSATSQVRNFLIMGWSIGSAARAAGRLQGTDGFAGVCVPASNERTFSLTMGERSHVCGDSSRPRREICPLWARSRRCIAYRGGRSPLLRCQYRPACTDGRLG